MAALTSERLTPVKGHGHVVAMEFPVAAGARIYGGALVVIEGGYATPGRTATGLISAGRARYTVDNTGGAAGAKWIEVERGAFVWANAAGVDAVAQANVGTNCYILDDQTVTVTATGRSVAGKILKLETGGVTVETL